MHENSYFRASGAIEGYFHWETTERPNGDVQVVESLKRTSKDHQSFALSVVCNQVKNHLVISIAEVQSIAGLQRSQCMRDFL